MNKKKWEMRATVLGWCATFPRECEATSSVLVETSEGSVLLDCGSGSLSKFYCISDVDHLTGAVVSHLHYDHMADLGCLQYAINQALRIGVRTEKLPVYAPASPAKMWEAIQYPFTVTTSLGEGMSFELAGMTITAKKVKHTIECYAFRLERNGKSIVYFTDTTYFPEAKDFVKGADLMFCGAPMTEGSVHSVGEGHMSDLEAGRLAKEGGVQDLCLIHLPSDVDLLPIKKRAESAYGRPVSMPNQVNVFQV